MANDLVTRAPPSGEGLFRTFPDMTGSTRYAGLAVMLLAAGIGRTAGGGALAGETGALEVTTDTPAYCLQLLDRVSSLVRDADAPPPQEVTHLSAEGQRMCDHGQTRGGIMRLRRALLILQRPR